MLNCWLKIYQIKVLELLGEDNLEMNQKIDILINKEIVNGVVVRKNKNFCGIMFHDMNKQAMFEIMRIYIENLEPYYKLKRDQIN